MSDLTALRDAMNRKHLEKGEIVWISQHLGVVVADFDRSKSVEILLLKETRETRFKDLFALPILDIFDVLDLPDVVLAVAQNHAAPGAHGSANGTVGIARSFPRVDQERARLSRTSIGGSVPQSRAPRLRCRCR